MKNWKTTLAGLVLAALYALVDALKNGTQIDDWKLWVVPVAIAVFGTLAKDFNVSGAVVKTLALALCGLATGCGTVTLLHGYVFRVIPFLLVASCLCLGSCGLQNKVVSDTTVTGPDGTVTRSTVTATNSDAALRVGADVTSLVLPYVLRSIIPEK